MNIFATNEFISELKTLTKSKSHEDCEKLIVESIYGKIFDELVQSSKRMGGNIDKTPFVMKRIAKDNEGKRSGYRLYLWLFKIEESLHLLFMHPKTGRKKGSNITDAKQKEIVREFLKDRKNGDLVELNVCLETKKFKKKEESKKIEYVI